MGKVRSSIGACGNGNLGLDQHEPGAMGRVVQADDNGKPIMSIRILLADDHNIVRDGLRALIEKYSDFEVVAEAADGRTAVRSALELRPDIVIMDISMPDMNGIEAARQITSGAEGIRVLTLSMHSDGRYVKQLFAAGASGYLLKECASSELINAIRAISADNIYLSPSIAHVVLTECLNTQPAAKASVFSLLTAREREVLQLMAEGKTTKEIAYSLDLSVKTVEAHRRNIMKKSNIHSIAMLTKFAIREGVTSLES
jgi:two-component system response regulator NreC